MSVSAKRKRRQSRTVLGEAILLAAESAAKGNCNRDFTIVQISKALGIAPSTIYDHFKNKNELALAVGHKLNPDLGRSISTIEIGRSGHMTDLPLGGRTRGGA